ncbi:MAG: hypothetical protein R3211_08175 [Balneolaceae bacterium]|nr:hypothetical protein [Balneolaceae bacterium]
MNHISTKILTLLFILVFGYSADSSSQSIKLLAGNTLNGTLNGAVIGGATMALNDSDDLEPLRIGVGVGILYGIGVGVYDLSQISKGQQFYISGTFNDGDNTTIIALLDTFYGAAAGAIIASSISLISKEPFDTSLQYGAGTGAWIGFGFGLFDAFVLAERPGDFQELSFRAPPSPEKGLLSVTGVQEKIYFNLVNPQLYSIKSFSAGAVQIRHRVGIEVMNVHVSL